MGSKYTERTPLSEVLAKQEEKPKEKPKSFNYQVKKAKEVKKDEALEFILCVERHPNENVTGIYHLLRLSGYKGNRIQKELVEEGYISEFKRGKSKYLRLTEKGYEAIGAEKPKGKGRGKDDHRFYQDKIKEHYEGLGYKAYVEKDLLGKAIDVLIRKPDCLVAIEVELHNTDHIIENIKRDLTVGVNEVVVVTKEDIYEKIKEKITKRSDEIEIEKVSIELIDKYLD